MSNHSEYPKEAGVYKLTCINNNKIYIGKAICLDKRLREHKSCKKETKRTCYFQRAILRHGWYSFRLEILEVFKDFDKVKDNVALLEREAYYIELFDSTDRDKGYNRCKHSNDLTGVSLSEETKEKMRQAKLGRKLSKEHVENMRQSQLGKTHSEETKAKMCKPKSEEHKANMRKPKSEETKAKMRNRIFSEESREKMRQAKLRKRVN